MAEKKNKCHGRGLCGIIRNNRAKQTVSCSNGEKMKLIWIFNIWLTIWQSRLAGIPGGGHSIRWCLGPSIGCGWLPHSFPPAPSSYRRPPRSANQRTAAITHTHTHGANHYSKPIIKWRPIRVHGQKLSSLSEKRVIKKEEEEISSTHNSVCGDECQTLLSSLPSDIESMSIALIMDWMAVMIFWNTSFVKVFLSSSV